MLQWLSDNQVVLTWLSVVSLLTFVGSLLALPWFVGVIPEDYFLHNRTIKSTSKQRNKTVHLLLLIGRNLLGCTLLLGGILMLFLPGQGLITIAISMLLLDYPGKKKLELRIISYPSILNGINWLRAKGNHPPLRFDP